MPRYHIWTIGCQMNKADSDYVAGFLEQAGYSAAGTAADADFILLNTCVVRQSAEDKVLNKLGSLKSLKRNRPNTILALTGCFVDSDADRLKDRFPWVDLVFGPRHWSPLYDWAASRGLQSPDEAPFFIPHTPPVSAFIPIVQGCNSFCSYCIVPYRRGREMSRQVDEICCEAEGLARQGVREITLLGQNIGSYGHDLPDRPDLADLLARLNDIEGLLRIRFLTNHPKDTDRKLIRAMADLDKVCEHISLPIQAGDDAILSAMRRGYSAAQYEDLVAQIRSTVPGMAISTDVIVGFPGETAEQYQNTLDILRRIRFDRVHTAAYSPRSGTIAARHCTDSVPPLEKQKRLHEADALHESIAAEINGNLKGKTVEVLVEGKKKGKWQGRTRGDKLVFFAHSGDLSGQPVQVRVERTTAWSLQGAVAGEVPPACT